MASAPVPGWYPDPTNGSQRRWWDGSAWTTHAEALTPAPDPDSVVNPILPGGSGPTWHQPLPPSSPTAIPGPTQGDNTQPGAGCTNSKLLIGLLGGVMALALLAGGIALVGSQTAPPVECEGLPVITPGDRISGSLELHNSDSVDDEGFDEYCLVLDNDFDEIRIRAFGGDGDLLLDLLDLTTGDFLADADNTIGSDPELNLSLASGFYSVAVWDYNGDPIDYRLEVSG